MLSTLETLYTSKSPLEVIDRAYRGTAIPQEIKNHEAPSDVFNLIYRDTRMTFPYREYAVPELLSSSSSSSFLSLCLYRFILTAVFSTSDPTVQHDPI